jgi:hypothetical protein
MTNGRRAGSDLPAAYVDPWRLLGQDLRAVLASLRLRLWELWRRNRGGELWRPAPWPEALAPLFWPLALALLLLGLGAGWIAVGASPGPERVAPPAVAGDSAPVGTKDRAPAAAANPLRESPPAEEAPVAPPPEPPPPDPLQEALGPPGVSSLLTAARAEPGRSLLVLTAAPAYAALPPSQRRERAEGWWRRGQELGYERLELRDGRGRLLARSAVVGGGLVLYEPPSAAAGGDPA